MSTFKALIKGCKAYNRLYIKHDEPVVILTPGRVGSMSLSLCLQEAGVFAIKVESVTREPRGMAQFALKHIFARKKPAKVITLVRDPISMFITYYMATANRGWYKGGQAAMEAGNLEAVQKHFIADVLAADRAQIMLNYLSTDFKQVTGIDVYDHSFDRERKYSIIEHDCYPTLIMRTELEDSMKEKAVQQFLSLDSFRLSRLNTAKNKPYKAIHKAFKESLSLPPKVLDDIYRHRYCTHFFTAEEIDELKNKWS